MPIRPRLSSSSVNVAARMGVGDWFRLCVPGATQHGAVHQHDVRAAGNAAERERIAEGSAERHHRQHAGAGLRGAERCGDDMLLRIAEAAAGRPYDSVVFSGYASFGPTAADAIAAADRAGLRPFPTTESPNGIKIQRAKLREMAERILREPAV